MRSLFQRFEHKLLRWWYRRSLEVWYHPSYRLPMTSFGALSGFEPRRADYVLWYWLDRGIISPEQVKEPRRIPYRELVRVHSCEYLETLTEATILSRIFAVEPWDIPVDEVMKSIRLACGGTLSAARSCLKSGGVAFNLMGGFHHASPDKGGGFCAVNDIAVACSVLRTEGFRGKIVVLDLDAHPPDGLADYHPYVENAWLGSLSGTDWGELPGVDETVLPAGADDDTYLKALEALLQRMPKAALAFVIAGGDVLAVDKLGGLGLSLHGARLRDKLVADALQEVPSVWLPAGGYHRDAWRVLAGTGMYLTARSLKPIPADLDPLKLQFRKIANSFLSEELEGDTLLTEEDLLASLGMAPEKPKRLLGFYTETGMELALYRYGLLDFIRRLGYGHFNVVVDGTPSGDRMRLFSEVDREEHLLMELVLEKQKIGDEWMLFIHWLTLRHPLSQFHESRPALPGQEVPGLGLARESGELLDLMAERLHLGGVAFQPAWFHIAYAMRRRFSFLSPERQGRFEALIRDMKHIPLKKATQLVADQKVTCNGEPYHWEGEVMIFHKDPSEEYEQIVEATKAEYHFEVISEVDGS